MRTRKVGLFDLDTSLAPEKPENLTPEEFELAREIACEALLDMTLLGGRNIGTAVTIVSELAGVSDGVRHGAVRWAAAIVTMLVGDTGRAVPCQPTSGAARRVVAALEDMGADRALIDRAREAKAAAELLETASTLESAVGSDLLQKARHLARAYWKKLTMALPKPGVGTCGAQDHAQVRPPSAPTSTPLCAEISPPYAPTPLCAENRGGDAPTWREMQVPAEEVVVGDQLFSSLRQPTPGTIWGWSTVVEIERRGGAVAIGTDLGKWLRHPSSVTYVRRCVTPLCADQQVSS